MRDEGHKGAKYIGQQSIREGRCSEARAEGAVVTQGGTNPETGRPEGVRAPLSASTRVVILSCCWDPRGLWVFERCLGTTSSIDSFIREAQLCGGSSYY